MVSRGAGPLPVMRPYTGVLADLQTAGKIRTPSARGHGFERIPHSGAGLGLGSPRKVRSMELLGSGSSLVSPRGPHRLIREPLELGRKWMIEGHLTLGHHQP